jgi:hypothetical protein
MRIPARLRTPAGRSLRAATRRRYAVERILFAEREIDHLVPEPVFIMCSVRSGSTLLRSILNTHRQICAPHELHLASMRVSTPREYAVNAWSALGLTTHDLENMLWDRALHRILVASGKRIIVDKTPQNANVWPRIQEFWPRARYIHLRRHPAAIYASLRAARPDQSPEHHLRTVNNYGRQLDEARAALPGPTVHYEQLTTEPRRVIGELCDYLGVRFQSRMLNYRPNRTRPGLGDWSARIKSGQIHPHPPLPPINQTPAELRELILAWGY